MSGELQARFTWAADLVLSSAGTAQDARGFGLENTFYFDSGASSSGVVNIQSARTATGPWVTIASTTVTSTAAGAILQVTGPFMFIRPTVPSSGGTWTVDMVSFG